VRDADCYIDIWRNANFEGESLRLRGPADYPNLRRLAQGDWSDQIGSLRVGPRALVLAYRDADFKDKRVTFGPNDEVADLHALKFDDDIDSVQVIDSMRIFDRLLGRTEPADEQTPPPGGRKKGKGKKR
jgi:Beta/Gamma crystallin